MNNLLEVKGLCKQYNEFTLDNISLQLPPGHIMGVIGPNGAGKTTTIKLIMNMIKSDGGEIDILGLKYPDDEKEIKNRIGYVGEEQYFYQNKTVAWTGKFVSNFFKAWDKNVFNAYLEDFRISRTKKIKELSKGMKTKLSFAIALSHAPEILILDEPTAGLDPVIRREILDLLLKVGREEEKSVIISSHITEDLARIADIITIMDNGKIILSKAKDDLLGNWKKIHFKKDSLDRNITTKLSQVEEQMFGSCGITNDYGKIKDQLTEGIARGYIKVENVTLDDILIANVKP